MEEKLKAYVYTCFEETPKTARTLEIREEICANVLERYRDLLVSGATPEEAYDIARRSVGNVQEILDGLEEEPEMIRQNLENTKKRSAFIGCGVALYILGPAVLIAAAAAGSPLIGTVLLLVCAAAATGLCVYGCNVYPRVPLAAVRGMSEAEAQQYNEWRAEQIAGIQRRKKYSGVLWPLIVAAYFVISFATGAWFITWIIFIIGAALDKLIEITAR